MPQRPFFRVGDRVTVHNFYESCLERTLRGRVICTNRLSRIDHPVVVLVDTETGSEVIETFMTDGHRGTLTNKQAYLTLGWEQEKQATDEESKDESET